MKKGLLFVLGAVFLMTTSCSKPNNDHRRKASASEKKADKEAKEAAKKENKAEKDKKDAKKEAAAAAATKAKDDKGAKDTAAGLETIGEKLFDLASEGKLAPDTMKDLLPTEKDVTGMVDDTKKFLKIVANEEKLSKKAKGWVEFCKGAKFKGVRKDSEFKLSKDEAPEKYKKLAAHLTKPLEAVEMKVWGKKTFKKDNKDNKKGKKDKKEKMDKKFKCNFVAARFESGWRIIKLKSCEWK